MIGVFSRHGRAAVLLLLGSDADPDVPHHRHLGRSAARLRDHQVLPVHLPRLGVHAGRAHLHVRARRGSYSIAELPGAAATLIEQRWIFVAFLLAFAVKVPMWPVHTWLPDAHVEAPTGGSVILAAIMLKMGGYGFLRFSLPITPGCQPRARPAGDRAVADRRGLHRLRRARAAGHEEADRLLVDRAHGLRDARARSSSTRSCARTGSVQGAAMGMDGAMVQMISHGLISGALFLCVGVLYDRVHSREIAAYGGVINTMPMFAAFMVLFALANAGLPGHLGVRRGVPGDHRQLQGELLVFVPGRRDAGARRRLHPVAGQARGLRPGDEPAGCRASGPQRAASSSCSACSPSRCCSWACGRRRC